MALTKVKMAVFAPMPKAMVRMTVAANPGDFWTWRRANFRFDMALGWTNEGREGKQIPQAAVAAFGITGGGCSNDQLLPAQVAVAVEDFGTEVGPEFWGEVDEAVVGDVDQKVAEDG